MWRLPPTTIENSAIKIYFTTLGVEKLAKEKGRYCGVSKPNNEIGKDCSGTKQRDLGQHIGKNSIVNKLNPFKSTKSKNRAPTGGNEMTDKLNKVCLDMAIRLIQGVKSGLKEEAMKKRMLDIANELITESE